jgi:hypothetical protein
MTKQSTYNCILYEPGDKVIEKHGSDEILEIEATRMSTVGIFTIQLLKFKNKLDDVGCFSNLYIPTGETETKYKDGIKRLEEVRVKKQIEHGTKIHKKLARKIKEDNTLTAEDLKPVIIPRGTFNARPPLKQESNGSL